MDKGYSGEARKALGHRMSRFVSFPYAFLGIALVSAGAIVSSCMGGSDGVENPKLEMDFHSQDGASAVSGRISIYGVGINPVEDNLPISAKDFTSGEKVSFTPEEMDAALKQAMVRGGKDSSTLGDTTVHFNVVAVSGDLETFVSGFSYRRSGATVGFSKLEGKVNSNYGAVVRSIRLPKAVKGFSGRMGIFGISKSIDYIFVPGSPYHATIDDDSTFTMPQMSPGSYNIIGKDTESQKLFKSADTLNTSDSAYSAKAWDTITFIPDGN